ncbi:putative activator of 90 kDa heat shock protein ATPase -like protein 1 isoform 1 [Capsicum annuum]|nr:putative activator of 90 kDa heat shock protein ATPase -like protein 1 isoform 1 [Capsicum annuum]
MSSISSSLFFPAFTSPLHISRQCLRLQPTHSCYRQYAFHNHGNITLSIHVQSASPHPYSNLQSGCSAIASSNDGTISMINIEDVMEKDWSFLEYLDSSEEHKQKIDKIISAGEITENSKVLIAISSNEFVDRVVDSSNFEQLLVVHDSIFMLACIKEKYDMVKCWQGELIYVPEKWAPFDVVFIYFLPALPFELGQILEALRKRCLPGARVVISHPQGRQVVEEQQKKYPDVVVSNLPEKMLLQNVAADHSFELVKFVDEPDFYLAILKFEAERA